MLQVHPQDSKALSQFFPCKECRLIGSTGAFVAPPLQQSLVELDFTGRDLWGAFKFDSIVFEENVKNNRHEFRPDFPEHPSPILALGVDVQFCLCDDQISRRL